MAVYPRRVNYPSSGTTDIGDRKILSIRHCTYVDIMYIVLCNRTLHKRLYIIGYFLFQKSSVQSRSSCHSHSRISPIFELVPQRTAPEFLTTDYITLCPSQSQEQKSNSASSTRSSTLTTYDG